MRLPRPDSAAAAPRFAKDHGERPVIAGNLLDRQLPAEAPNPKWVVDFT